MGAIFSPFPVVTQSASSTGAVIIIIRIIIHVYNNNMCTRLGAQHRGICTNLQQQQQQKTQQYYIGTLQWRMRRRVSPSKRHFRCSDTVILLRSKNARSDVTDVTDLEAVQVKSVDFVVAVPLDRRRRVASRHAVKHGAVTLDNCRVRRTNFELGPHCNRQQKHHTVTSLSEKPGCLLS